MGDGTKATGKVKLLLRLARSLRLKISAKILLYFLLVALVPLVVVSYVLVTSANNQLLQNASTKQQTIATDLTRRVNNYLANNANLLAYTGRLYSAKELDATQIDNSILTLFEQNVTLKRIILMTISDETGNERKYEALPDGTIKIEDKQLDTSAEILKFLEDKPYFISTGRDQDNSPEVGIGIPILKKYGPANDELFNSQGGTADNLSGAIAGYYDISNLWQSVLSTKNDNGAYAYVVDSTGTLVAHPDSGFLDSHQKIDNVQSVRRFLNNDLTTTRTISEKNIDVVSTPRKTINNWGVIVQEPVKSIYASINSYIQLAATVGVIAIILSTIVGIFFSRQLIRPIRELTMGAKRMERGEFDRPINVKTNDELEELADTFNGMAQGIKKLISDLKTNNVRLKFEQIKLNNIISSVSDGVIAVNSKGEILSINPPAAKMIDKNPKTLEGKSISDQFPFKHDEEPFAPDLTNGGIYHYTDLTLAHNSSIIYLDLMVAVLEHPDSDVAAIITLHDQTASRELSFMKLDFVAIAAHELRTPLTVVRGYLDILNTSAAKELSVFNIENLSKAIVGANQLRELINKLLNIARIERGDMEIFIEKLNISKLVRDNVEQHKSMAAQKQQILSYNADTDSNVYSPADAASIVEVLNNLVGNAMKYNGKGGQIVVNLTTNDKEVRIEVADDGPGVPDDLRERLFTKFYRAERSLISGTRGTGLGLFISKTIIELQNGKIGIEPDKGTGSAFYFTLPIYDPARDDEQVAKKSSGGIRGWFKKRPSS